MSYPKRRYSNVCLKAPLSAKSSVKCKDVENVTERHTVAHSFQLKF